MLCLDEWIRWSEAEGSCANSVSGVGGDELHCGKVEGAWRILRRSWRVYFRYEVCWPVMKCWS